LIAVSAPEFVVVSKKNKKRTSNGLTSTAPTSTALAASAALLSMHREP
jgi:hypothetical protein